MLLSMLSATSEQIFNLVIPVSHIHFQVLQFWMTLFKGLEDDGLRINNAYHISCLHYVFLPRYVTAFIYCFIFIVFVFISCYLKTNRLFFLLFYHLSWLLSRHLFDRIQQELDRAKMTWNHHKISTERNK